MRARLAVSLLAGDIVFFLVLLGMWHFAPNQTGAWGVGGIPLAAGALAGGLSWLGQKSRPAWWPGWPRIQNLLARPLVQGLLAGLSLLAIYLLLTGGHFYSSDDMRRYLTTRSLVEQGSLDISYPPGRPAMPAKYGIVQPLLSAPLYVLGRAFKADTPARAKLDEVMVGALMALITACAAMVFFLFLRGLWLSSGHKPGVGLYFRPGQHCLSLCQILFLGALERALPAALRLAAPSPSPARLAVVFGRGRRGLGPGSGQHAHAADLGRAGSGLLFDMAALAPARGPQPGLESDR